MGVMIDSPELLMRAAGLRVTSPRLAVYGALEQARVTGRHLTAAEITAEARERIGAVSTQAVYDCLDALADAGLVRRIEPAGQAALYESRVGDNHHHLVCRGCGRTVDVDCTHGAAPCLTPSDQAGFVVDEAEVIFWGRCEQCAHADSGTAAGEVSSRERRGPVGASAVAHRPNHHSERTP